MKKTLILMIAVSLLSLFCSCSQLTTEYTEPQDYETVWNTTGPWLQAHHYYEGVSPLFPQTLDGLNVSDFYGYYREKLPVGESIQIYVAVCYDTQEDFERELARIETVAPIEDSEHFACPAAVAALGWQNCMEYALVDRENLTVRYIYMEFCNLDEIEIPADCLPVGYKDNCCLEDGTSFIVYDEPVWPYDESEET